MVPVEHIGQYFLFTITQISNNLGNNVLVTMKLTGLIRVSSAEVVHILVEVGEGGLEVSRGSNKSIHFDQLGLTEKIKLYYFV